MTTRARAVRRRPSLSTPDLDRVIAHAERQAVVIWRGEHVAFSEVPQRIAAMGDRTGRDLLFNSYLEAVDALNPLYEQRRQRWRTAAAQSGSGDVLDLAAAPGVDPREMAVDLERFVVHSETVYYAALRRHLAVMDIEQGDATVADMWHVERGGAWSRWFGERELRRAVAAVGAVGAPVGAGSGGGGTSDLDGEGWRSAEEMLASRADAADATVAGALRELYASLPGNPEWLGTELQVATEEVAALADFVAFVRLWRFRHAMGLLQYELRLYGEDDPDLLRAYYAGIVGHMIGVAVPEAAYLHEVDAPLASARRLRQLMLAATIEEALESRIGPGWWRDGSGAELLDALGAAQGVEDALALVGYDAVDWRPVLRQVRTRLIGEMSGYGGPNITTRAGTRKV